MNFISLLNKWYKKNKRPLPWRKTSDPYNIWISEIIFQQTRIEQGTNYYNNFIRKFPNLEKLALSTEDEVLHMWKGLGYYSRAHNLFFTAQHIYNDLEGIFPSTYSDILKLKGIGKYTAAAIASISFNEKIPAIDGNAFRVYSRFFNSEKDISKSSTFKYFFNLMLPLMPDNPGDFNQAIMDLGAIICSPSNPKCIICPIQVDCIAYKLNNQKTLPIKSSYKKITELNIHYAYVKCHREILIIKRGYNDIWKGLYEFPKFKDIHENYKISNTYTTTHKLTHKILHITISEINLESPEFYTIAKALNATILDKKQLKLYAFPKPLDFFLLYN